MNIREKIEVRLNEVDRLMKQNKHLNDADLVLEKVEDVSKFWSVLSEEDKEFIGAVRFAIRAQMRWE